MALDDTQMLLREQLEIPTLPQVVAKLNAMIEDPEVGTKQIGLAVREDPPLAAKVLQIANSAFYVRSEPITSIEHASAVLGVRMLRNVVLQASVLSRYDHLDGEDAFDVTELWRHAVLVAQVASSLATRCRVRLGLAPEEIYMVGLLHDIGLVVLLDTLGPRYMQVLRAAADEGLPIFRVERRELTLDHTEVGARVAVAWGLPRAVADGIRFHHGPREAVERDPVVALVANVNLLARRVAVGDREGAEAVFDGPTARLLGLGPDDVVDIVAEAAILLSEIVI